MSNIDLSGIQHRRVRNGAVELHAAFAGDGPLVLMVHGNPGLWYSWRHQLAPLAAAGYRAVAIDCRGYGASSRPRETAAYESPLFQQDLHAVLDAFGAERAFVVGQDFGAQHAWNFAVRSPRRVIGVCGMVPFDYDLAGRFCEPDGDVARTPPTVRFAAVARQHFFHMHYYQQVGEPEAEFAANPREYLKRLFFALSAQGNLFAWEAFPSEGTHYLDVLPEAPPLPWGWFTPADLDYYVQEFMRGGPDLAFAGPLASYRVADRNWEIGAPWARASVERPSLFLCGKSDPVLTMSPPDTLSRQRARLTDLRGEVLVEGAGHFVQQEKPAETTAALLAFLDEVRREERL